MWIDTHCHLDASEFSHDIVQVVLRARKAGVLMQVVPAVRVAHFDAVRDLAHRWGLVYALGVHPLYVDEAGANDMSVLASHLEANLHDFRLVAVGEIGLDGFVVGCDGPRHRDFYDAQLTLAKQHNLPVIVHVRRSADALLKSLRRIRPPGGIAHAFNGSFQQAHQFLDLGFKLGFGGTMTFERALQIRRLAAELPLDALVLETDAPDMPPQWLYQTAAQREQSGQSRNEPAQIPRIAQTLATLRGLSLEEIKAITTANAMAALPRLGGLGLC